MWQLQKKVSDEAIQKFVEDLTPQNSALLIQQTDTLSSHQTNMLRTIACGIHRGYTAKDIMERFPFATKSNIARIKKVLIDKELVNLRKNGLYMTDPVFLKWFKRF